MWVSKKEWNSLQKKITDLEKETQSQRNALIKHLDDHTQENEELREILENIKRDFTAEHKKGVTI